MRIHSQQGRSQGAGFAPPEKLYGEKLYHTQVKTGKLKEKEKNQGKRRRLRG